MIHVGLSERVAARRGRVWAALAEPAQAVEWRPGRLRALDPAVPYPETGRTVRWRCRVRALPMLLRETPVEIRPGELLRARLALGPFRYEASFALTTPEDESEGTRVGLRIATRNRVAMLGGSLDRFDVRGLAAELTHRHLRALVGWCERGERARELDLALPGAATAGGSGPGSAGESEAGPGYEKLTGIDL